MIDRSVIFFIYMLEECLYELFSSLKDIEDEDMDFFGTHLKQLSFCFVFG